MEETPMLYAIAPAEYWKQMRAIVEEIVDAKFKSLDVRAFNNPSSLPGPLLKLTEVCAIFHVSKPTMYEWMKQGRLKSFKIRSRRYFASADIQSLIQQGQAKF